MFSHLNKDLFVRTKVSFNILKDYFLGFGGGLTFSQILF